MNDDLDDIGLFDMDGSLADYEAALQRDLKCLSSPEEPPIGDLWDDSRPYLAARMRLIKSTPRWWASLPPIPEGMRVFKIAFELGFDNQILTKGPKKHSRAWMEKVEWCQHHFGEEIDIHVVSDKKLVYGKFLYDDYPDYMLRWLQHRPRGLGIMPVTPYNRDFRHPNVLMYDGTNVDAVRLALNSVKQRKPGQPLDLTGVAR